MSAFYSVSLRTSATMVVEMEAASSSHLQSNNPLVIKPSEISRKRSSCPNLKLYVDENNEVGASVDLSPTMDVDVEATYIEEKCCFVVPSGFLSGRKEGRRSSAEV